jgi:hypothetical protein
MINCSKCGRSVEDAASFCPYCGAQLAQGPQPPEPPGPPAAQSRYGEAPIFRAEPAPPPSRGGNDAQLWMILNIVAAVLCCLIPAVIGIVFGAVGMNSYNHGDYADADKKASVSKIMFIVSVCLGAVALVIYLLTRFGSIYY